MRHLFIASSLLAGALLGWFLVPSGGVHPAALESAAPSQGLTPPLPAEPGAVISEESATSTESENYSAPAAADLASLLARFPVREYPTGSGAITGRVVRHDDGSPIAGIAIDAIIHGTTPGVEQVGVDHPELLPFILEEIDQYHYDVAMARRAITDEEGQYRAEGLLPDAQYHLTPGPSDEWFVFTLEARAQLSPGSQVEFRAAPLAFAEVEVVDGEGAPIAMGTIELRDPSGENETRFSARFSPRNREVRVPLPFTSLVARLDDGRVSEPVEIALDPGGRLSVRLVVRERSGFDVSILAADRVDLVWVEVLIALDDGEPFPEDIQQFRYDSGTEYEHVDPETGKVRFTVEPGRYRIFLLRDGKEIHSQAATLGEGRTEITFSIPPLDRSRVSIVTVLDPEGIPLESVSLELVSRLRFPDGGEHDWNRATTSIRLGRGEHAVVVGLGDEDELDPTRSVIGDRLRCQSELYGVLEAPISIGASAVEEYRYVEPAELIVDLVDYLGSDLQGRVTVRVVAADGDENGLEEWGSVDPLGRVTFPPISPGVRLVRVGNWNRWRPVALVEREIALVPGENAFSLVLPELHRLAVRYPSGGRGRSVRLRDEEGQWIANEEIGEDGFAEFSDLTPGTYRLGDEMESMEVRVPVGGEIEFRPVAANALVVTITEEEGWLARTGFHDGDRIIGIDGELYAGVRTLQYALMRAISRGGGELILERDGQEVRLTLPGDDPTSFLELGGELEPAIRGGGR